MEVLTVAASVFIFAMSQKSFFSGCEGKTSARFLLDAVK